MDVYERDLYLMKLQSKVASFQVFGASQILKFRIILQLYSWHLSLICTPYI